MLNDETGLGHSLFFHEGEIFNPCLGGYKPFKNDDGIGRAAKSKSLPQMDFP